MDLKNDIEYLEKEVEEYKNPKYESKQCLVLYDAVHGKELQLYNSENIIEYCDGLLLIKSKEDGQTLFQGDLDQFVVFTSKRKLKKT